jgi:phage repressor protein C with HTH and peptisase S24 domain
MIEATPALKAVIDETRPVASASRVTSGEVLAVPDLPVLLASTQNVNARDGVFANAPLKTQRPPFLANDARAFALLMPDTSMHPRFDAGDMLYASPARDLGGDHVDVVVERPNGGFIAGGLAGVTSDTVKLALLMPRSRQSFARDKIRGVYRIVGVQRLGS